MNLLNKTLFLGLVTYAMIIMYMSMRYLNSTDCNKSIDVITGVLEKQSPDPANAAVSDIHISSIAGANSGSSCIPKVGLRPLKKRDDLLDLVMEHGFTTAIEIGVKGGNFAKHMLKHWKSCEKYHLVDLWAHQENYEDASNGSDKKHEYMYNRSQRRLKPWQNVTEYHRMLSTEAAKKFEKESIDFIYIDARHDYCGVKEDIEHYWPILKPGGIMAGHDYNENSEIPDQDWGLCGDGTRNEMAVKGAVNDFFLPKGYTISVTYYREDNYMSWMIQKRLC